MKADYYAQVEYFQFDLEEFDELYDAGKYEELLAYAEMWDAGDGEIDEIHRTPCYYPGDELIEEDAEYVLVRNWRAGGHYTLLRKMSQQQFDEENERLNGGLVELYNRYNDSRYGED